MPGNEYYKAFYGMGVIICVGVTGFVLTKMSVVKNKAKAMKARERDALKGDQEHVGQNNTGAG